MTLAQVRDLTCDDFELMHMYTRVYPIEYGPCDKGLLSTQENDDEQQERLAKQWGKK